MLAQRDESDAGSAAVAVCGIVAGGPILVASVWVTAKIVIPGAVWVATVLAAVLGLLPR